jgi:hypothetical protein
LEWYHVLEPLLRLLVEVFLNVAASLLVTMTIGCLWGWTTYQLCHARKRLSLPLKRALMRVSEVFDFRKVILEHMVKNCENKVNPD